MHLVHCSAVSPKRRGTRMTGAALGRTAGHDVAELLSSAELKSVRAGEGEDALDANISILLLLITN